MLPFSELPPPPAASSIGDETVFDSVSEYYVARYYGHIGGGGTYHIRNYACAVFTQMSLTVLYGV